MTVNAPAGAPPSLGTDPGDPSRADIVGGVGEQLSSDEVSAFVTRALARADLDDKRVCLVVPDGTRTCPLPLAHAGGALGPRGQGEGGHGGDRSRHPPRDERGPSGASSGLLGGRREETYPGWTIINHESWLPETFTTLGSIGAERLTRADRWSDARHLRGRADQPARRGVRRGDRGGPGVSARGGRVLRRQQVLLSWGVRPGADRPVALGGRLDHERQDDRDAWRDPGTRLINEAATLIPADRLALCLVVASGTDTLHAAAFGTPEDAWAACAEISAETHVTYLDTPVKRVLSIMPTKYEDIWTAAKGFYKLEPIVADGGEVIIYAPHITQVSVMHPQITEIGYHCRDYFLGQWDRFKDQPWGDLAHSTHLRGQGTWDPEHGERDRVTVTLATGIPEEIVRSVNLNYLDPATVDIAAYEADPETFVEPHAGEVLYRLRSAGSGTGRGEPDGRQPSPRSGLDG